jgi:hypothetical protein
MPPRKSSATKAAEAEAEEATAAEEPEAGEPRPGPLRSVSNESPPLAPNAANGAARSRAMLDHAREALASDDPDRAAAIIERAQAELDRYIPDDVRGSGVAEAAHVVATEV